jgi:hypothetical protein
MRPTALLLVCSIACTPKPTAADPISPVHAPSVAAVEDEPSEAPPPSEPPREPPPADTGSCDTAECDVAEAIAKMASFADSMCRCTDAPCAEALTAEMVAYGEAMAKKHEGKPEPPVTDAQKKELETSMMRLTECTTSVFSK